MLILSRKRNEQIVIGDGIVITVVAIRGGNVRLGIEAPSNVAVHRQEVYQAIRDGRVEATAADEPSHSEGTASDMPG
jgi:carbon storage regulator